MALLGFRVHVARREAADTFGWRRAILSECNAPSAEFAIYDDHHDEFSA